MPRPVPLDAVDFGGGVPLWCLVPAEQADLPERDRAENPQRSRAVLDPYGASGSEGVEPTAVQRPPGDLVVVDGTDGHAGWRPGVGVPNSRLELARDVERPPRGLHGKQMDMMVVQAGKERPTAAPDLHIPPTCRSSH